MWHRLGAGRLGQAMEPLNRVLDASWWRLEEFKFGGVLKPSRCVLESLEGVWRAPKQAQASFEEGLERFCKVLGCFFQV